MKLKNPFTDMRTVGRLLEGAEGHARRAGEDPPGAEHLLLSALDLPDGSARAAFEAVGADPGDLPDAIAAQHADALRAVDIDAPDDEPDPPAAEEPRRGRGAFRSTGAAQTAFREAVRLSKPGHLRGGHVVAAVAWMERGTAVRALDRMGIERAALARAAMDAARAAR
ncbi:MAG: Clp protease N-terminal domain-containing protein [Thermoleophilia bacterium]